MHTPRRPARATLGPTPRGSEAPCPEEGSCTVMHLSELEAEAIHIIREVAAEFERPVMLYSIGKDSSVMLHLALKAFYPAKPPFPLLHIDTTWKFREMIAFRDRVVADAGGELLVHTNQAGLEGGADPFTLDAATYTDIMKTQALRQALDLGGFDAAFGGARRDEEASRAKERVFSFRGRDHCWDPRDQRPELWRIYNARIDAGESIRAFPLSNWTELDVWEYIWRESIPVVGLYLAARRPVVERSGQLIVVDDERMPLEHGELPRLEWVRFRTLGCYPLTAAVPSRADTVEKVLNEMLVTGTSERGGRLIDQDSDGGGLEAKKRLGYF